MRPGGLKRFFDGLLPPYADIGEQSVIKFEKLPALVPSLTLQRHSDQPCRRVFQDHLRLGNDGGAVSI